MTIRKRTSRAVKASERAEALDAQSPAAGGGFPGTHNRESEAAMADGVSPSAGSAPLSHVGDRYWGRGGRYIVGSDGIRRPRPATEE
ncbi:MAG: hypothetical protein KJZ96_15645 [Rhodocyclaceae bacterium]|nr:hypothetical protein [Rhodocyclaceae bacterium]